MFMDYKYDQEITKYKFYLLFEIISIDLNKNIDNHKKPCDDVGVKFVVEEFLIHRRLPHEDNKEDKKKNLSDFEDEIKAKIENFRNESENLMSIGRKSIKPPENLLNLVTSEEKILKSENYDSNSKEQVHKQDDPPTLSPKNSQNIPSTSGSARNSKDSQNTTSLLPVPKEPEDSKFKVEFAKTPRESGESKKSSSSQTKKPSFGIKKLKMTSTHHHMRWCFSNHVIEYDVIRGNEILASASLSTTIHFNNSFRSQDFDSEESISTLNLRKKNGVDAGKMTVRIVVIKGEKLTDNLNTLHGRRAIMGFM